MEKRRNAQVKAELELHKKTSETLVQKERHGELLRWLSDKNNYQEIQNHVRNVLKEIWHRDVEYTVHGDPSIDIRSVIYFVENGFLPSVYANRLNVTYRTGNFGFTKKMTEEEFWNLKLWVLRTLKKQGIYVGLFGDVLGGEWKYINPDY